MAVLNLGFTGMDSTTEAELRRAFEQALPAAGGGWQLVSDTHADYVVVDMDSMYGPMSWLRLHAAGKQVIGLTAAPRSQTPFRIGRPVNADDLAQLLREMRGVAPEAEPVSRAVEPSPPAAPASVPSGMTPSPQPHDQLPEELPAASTKMELPQDEAAAIEPAKPADEPPSSAVAQKLPPAPSIAPHVPAPTPPAAPPPARSAEPETLAEWLASGQLRGKLRYQRGDAAVLIDADQRTYHGPATLKPLAPLFEGTIKRTDLEAASADVWAAQSAAMGAAQPLARLIWFGALQAGGGRIVSGYEADSRFKLTKWPQTEREFPKHFRIATAMMKGPATLAEIAQAANVPEPDVADFINASLATGFAEPYVEPEPEPESPKAGGLLGRLRGR